ncbi:S24 family peptidase [Chitinophaga sp. CF418]|uniref:S24 family peptidase n=1 Tax=Chitinophaga sp. CF418 TaxID=1855287 RepID=UPI0009149DF1|nr:S24 family peptidase [Chitinophaga sp. CF418]SHN42320.1 Helix-turn-helix [Chitinophaga sp. CF418]
MSVNQRIKAYLEENKINVTDFAEKTGISRTTLSSITNNPSGTPLKRTMDMILAAYPDLGKNWLMPDEKDDSSSFSDESDNFSNSRALKFRIALKAKKKPVPMTNTKASAGTIALFNDEPELIVEFLDIPFIGIVDGAIEVVGESMVPTFKNGSRAAVRKLEDKTLINWGEIYYIVDTNYEGVVKRLYAGTDDTHIVLKSDNPDQETYPPFPRKWQHIVAVFKVKAEITKH